MKKLLYILFLGLLSCNGQVPDQEPMASLPEYKPVGMLVGYRGSYVAWVYEINGYTVIASYKGGSSVIPKPFRDTVPERPYLPK